MGIFFHALLTFNSCHNKQLLTALHRTAHKSATHERIRAHTHTNTRKSTTKLNATLLMQSIVKSRPQYLNGAIFNSYYFSLYMITASTTEPKHFLWLCYWYHSWKTWIGHEVETRTHIRAQLHVRTHTNEGKGERTNLLADSPSFQLKNPKLIQHRFALKAHTNWEFWICPV